MSSAEPPQLKQTYFNQPGRVEAIRLTLHIGAILFTDDRLAHEEFGIRKSRGEHPFGGVPVLQGDDGELYAQFDALLRYCGKLCGLYPRDTPPALRVDEFCAMLEDTVIGLFKDPSESGRKRFIEVELPRYFRQETESRRRQMVRFCLRKRF